MSYMIAQALLKTLIATTSGLASSTTEGDYTILDKGYDSACILVPGPLPEYDTAGMTREHTWIAYADLFARVVSDYNVLGTLRDAVIATVDDDPVLSDIFVVTSISGDDPEEIGNYVTQRLRITIKECV